jgi:hypothetical protein
MKNFVLAPVSNSAVLVNTLNKPLGFENISQTKHTWVFFDDKFSLIAHAGKNGFSILPEWLDRVEDYLEYKVIDKHGQRIRT